eukprot:1187565-Prorocentrum_minimum.AAC.2
MRKHRRRNRRNRRYGSGDGFGLSPPRRRLRPLSAAPCPPGFALHLGSRLGRLKLRHERRPVFDLHLVGGGHVLPDLVEVEVAVGVRRGGVQLRGVLEVPEPAGPKLTNEYQRVASEPKYPKRTSSTWARRTGQPHRHPGALHPPKGPPESIGLRPFGEGGF